MTHMAKCMIWTRFAFANHLKREGVFSRGHERTWFSNIIYNAPPEVKTRCLLMCFFISTPIFVLNFTLFWFNALFN